MTRPGDTDLGTFSAVRLDEVSQRARWCNRSRVAIRHPSQGDSLSDRIAFWQAVEIVD